MNNDLISRSALKEALDEQMNFDENCRDSIFAIIDNAPTVEGYENVIVGGMNNPYNAGYMEGIRQAYKELERPHGEWNYIQAGMCVCPFCGAIPHKLYKDFCAKCGADMRPKKKLQTPSCLTNPERQAELLERYKEE